METVRTLFKSILSLGLFHFNRYSTEHILIFFFVFFIHNNKFTGILTAFLLSFFLILFLSLCLCFQNLDYDLLFFNKESPDDPGNTQKKLLVSKRTLKKKLAYLISHISFDSIYIQCPGFQTNSGTSPKSAHLCKCLCTTCG